MLLIAGVLLLAGLAEPQQSMDPMCTQSTSSDTCTLTFNAFGTGQSGPTSTVYGAYMTTYLNVVNCNYCQVTNNAFNQPKTGPFTTKTTVPMMTITEVGCETFANGVTGRSFRGVYKPTTLDTPVPTTVFPAPNLHKRQTPTNTTGLSDELVSLITELNTALFCIELINNPKNNLTELCESYSNYNSTPQSSQIAIDPAQAAAILCEADILNVTYIDNSIVELLPEGIYALELAGNYTGTTNTTQLCNEINFNITTLPALSINGSAIQSFVCNAGGPSTTPATAPSTAPSIGTTMPMFTATVPAAGTGVPDSPYGNFTGLPAGTSGVYGSGSDTSFSSGTSGGYGQRPSGWTGLPTGTGGGGYGQPTGSTSAAGTGSIYAFPTGDASDSWSLTFPPPLTSDTPHVPPSPGTVQYYPAVSTSSSAIPNGYGYGQEY